MLPALRSSLLDLQIVHLATGRQFWFVELGEQVLKRLWRGGTLLDKHALGQICEVVLAFKQGVKALVGPYKLKVGGSSLIVANHSDACLQVPKDNFVPSVIPNGCYLFFWFFWGQRIALVWAWWRWILFNRRRSWGLFRIFKGELPLTISELSFWVCSES
jgi:hypothetical protein